MVEKSLTFRWSGGKFLKVTKLLQSHYLSICLPVTLLLMNFELIGQLQPDLTKKNISKGTNFFWYCDSWQPSEGRYTM